jgi:hypothetical protein
VKPIKVECDDLQYLVRAVAGDKGAAYHVFRKQCVDQTADFLRLDFGFGYGKDKSGYFMLTVNYAGIAVTHYGHEEADGTTVLSWKWQRPSKPKKRKAKR